MNIEEIRQLVANRRLIDGERDYVLDNELADAVDTLLSLIDQYKTTLKMVGEAYIPYPHDSEVYQVADTLKNIANSALEKE